MTKSIEELRKIINEQDAALLIKSQNEQLNRMEQEAFDRLKMRLIDEEGMNDLPPADMLQKLHPKPTTYELQSANKESLSKIFENFAKEFGKENIINGNMLCFPNEAKANDFFERQSKEGHAFLCQKATSDGTCCDHFQFSDDKGNYKAGSKADILAFCKSKSIEVPLALSAEKAIEEDKAPSMSRG